MLVLYGLGTTIGAGIYALTGEVAGSAGTRAPLAFLVAAALAGITGLGFAELAGRLPKAAGEAVFVEHAFARRRVTQAVGAAVLDTVSAPDFLAGVREAGAHLTAGLEALAARHDFGAVRGRGLLLALDLKRDAGPALVEAAMQRGLLINAPRPDSLRFMPALNVSTAEIDQMLAILDAACAAMGSDPKG